ncbi:MAG TPA: TPR end-of-group domain-containing protein [Elainellaceae cyanobacterium]
MNKLGRYDDAVKSFERSLACRLENISAWYGKACAYSAQEVADMTVQSLYRAIVMGPNLSKLIAQTDSAFDSIRHTKEFQALL